MTGMAEYIDLESAVEAAKHAWSKGIEPSQYIEIIPAADVAPVRHGRWAIDEFGHYCTACREYGSEIEGDAEIAELLKYGTPYCPNCGAKME